MVVWPGCTDEVSKVVEICHENNIPMVPFGTGTGLEGGATGIKVAICTMTCFMFYLFYYPTGVLYTVR